MNATIYHAHGFGISKEEVNLISISRTNYAQYKNTPVIQFIRKKKRKVTGLVLTYAPWTVIIKGHGHIDPPSGVIVRSSGGCEIRESKYEMFNERYKTDFDQQITDYIQAQDVILDVRHTVNTNELTLIS